jgi:hypothetical protein
VKAKITLVVDLGHTFFATWQFFLFLVLIKVPRKKLGVRKFRFYDGRTLGFFQSLFSANEKEEKWVSLSLFTLHLFEKESKEMSF